MTGRRGDDMNLLRMSTKRMIWAVVETLFGPDGRPDHAQRGRRTRERWGVLGSDARETTVILGLFAVLWFLLALPSSSAALTTYYVDPDYTGTPRNGNAASPWQSLEDTVTNNPWNTINAALISGDVTVYLSARNAGSDTNQASPVELNLRRTNTSSNLLILDGIS